MKETINYKLKKPDLTDYVNIGDLNENADIVDAELKKQSNEASNHKEDITSQEGRHGLRYWDRKFEIRIDGEWVEYKRIPVGTVKDFVAYPKSSPFFYILLFIKNIPIFASPNKKGTEFN